MDKSILEDRPLFMNDKKQPVHLFELEEQGYAMAAATDLILYTLEQLHHDDENASLQAQSVLRGIRTLVSSMKRDVEAYFIPDVIETLRAFQEGFEKTRERTKEEEAE